MLFLGRLINYFLSFLIFNFPRPGCNVHKFWNPGMILVGSLSHLLISYLSSGEEGVYRDHFDVQYLCSCQLVGFKKAQRWYNVKYEALFTLVLGKFWWEKPQHYFVLIFQHFFLVFLKLENCKEAQSLCKQYHRQGEMGTYSASHYIQETYWLVLVISIIRKMVQMANIKYLSWAGYYNKCIKCFISYITKTPQSRYYSSRFYFYLFLKINFSKV